MVKYTNKLWFNIQSILIHKRRKQKNNKFSVKYYSIREKDQQKNFLNLYVENWFQQIEKTFV